MPRITLSLCLIVKDEEETLPSCLGSVRDLVDECVVLDTGSTDRTIAVARSFDCRVFEDVWTDDFSRARNASFSHATGDFIFWLDADDVLLAADRERFRAFRRTLRATAAGFTMVYDYAQDANGASILRFRLPRVVRRSAGFRWVGRVHEYLDGPGPLESADVIVTHNRTRSSGDRNLRIYRSMVQNGETFSPRDRLYFANELADHHLWDEAIPLYQSSADDAGLWLEDRLWALNRLAEAYEAQGDRDAMRRVVMRGFDWDAPRPEACCRLGYDALQQGQPRAAAAWYDMAIRWAPAETGGFRIEACHTWLPHLQLAVCLSALGELSRACWHNEQAARWVPEDPNVRHNRAWFQSQGLDPAAIAGLPAEPA
ncbi:MAG: tetratricopeptide repeat-containing glycosyltransferase family 2 protein [Clostridia bacterium]